MARSLRIVLTVVLALLLAKAVAHLILIAHVTAQSEYVGDSRLFLAVGRGLLNGLTPYVDIWENKPLGVFLLTALSLRLNDGFLSLMVFETLSMAGLPLILAAAVYWRTKKTPHNERRLRTAVAFLSGMILAQFSFVQNDGLMTECFGALPGTAFVALLALAPARLTWHWILALGACFFGAVFFKEPFAFTLAAAILVLRPLSWRTVRETLSYGAVAAVLLAAVLALTGTLAAYFGTYLPYLVQYHSVLMGLVRLEYETEPLWMNGLHPYRLWFHFSYASPLLGLPVLTAWICWLMRPVLERARIRPAHFLAVALSTYLAIFGASLSGETGHRIVATVPWVAALFLACEDWLCARPARVRAAGAVVAGATLLANLLMPMAMPDDTLRQKVVEGEAFGKQIDAVLDACGVERYLSLSNVLQEPQGYTRHSPLAAGPFAVRLEFRLAVPLFRDMIRTSLEEAEIVILKNPETVSTIEYGPMTAKLLEDVHARFTEEPWPCAGNPDFPDDLFVLFRSR